jgi:hypothetical protein
LRKGTPLMVSFIKRVGESRDLQVTNEGSLSGFAKYYSGETSSSSFQHLVDELNGVAKLHDGWLKNGLGASASLNDGGYRQVATQGSSAQLAAFIRRVIRAHGLVVANEGSLAGFANYYHAQKGQITFNHLIQELDNISKLPDGWLKRGAPPVTGLTASMDTQGCKAIQGKPKANDDMSVFVRRVAEARHYHVVDEGGLAGFARFYSSPSAGGFTRMVQELDQISGQPTGWLKNGGSAPTGLSVKLDDAGCKALQSNYGKVKGSQEMAVFIRRVAESRLYGIADEGGLQGFAKYYSGVAGAWDFSHMLQEMDKVRELPTGWLKALGLD